MDKLLNIIERNSKSKNNRYRIDVDIIVSVKNHLMGFRINDEFLILNDKKIFTFRLKYDNIIDKKGFKLKAFINKNKINMPSLVDYFSFNSDNPFAFKFLISVALRLKKVDSQTINTQFPPLNLKKDNKTIEKFNRIIMESKTGDSLFTFNRNSNVSKLIRKYDYSQFSHVASVYDNNIIYEMTTSGINRRKISDLNPFEYDIALYRKVIEFNEIGIKAYKRSLDIHLIMKVKYNWFKIYKILLIKKFRIFGIFEKSKRFISI